MSRFRLREQKSRRGVRAFVDLAGQRAGPTALRTLGQTCISSVYLTWSVVVVTEAIEQTGNILRNQYLLPLNNDISFCKMECHSMVAADAICSRW